MYSDVQDKSEDLLAAAEDLLSENPNAVSGFLNADADEEEDESAPFAVNTLNPTMSNSLLERIQQQKNASSSNGSSFETPAPASAAFVPEEAEAEAEAEAEFGYPPVSENYTYATGPTLGSQSQQQQQQQPAGVHIPNYAAPQGPNPYDTSGSGSNNGGDMMNQVLSAASNVASRAYYGTKHVMSGMMGAPPSSSGGPGTRPEQGANRMHSMDYQRESLLMDPHEMEEVGGIGHGGGGDGGVRGFFGTSSTESNGLMGSGSGAGGMETTAGTSNSSGERGLGYTMLGYLKTFCIDMKDLFLSSPRHIQAFVVVLIILISWLLFSEV